MDNVISLFAAQTAQKSETVTIVVPCYNEAERLDVNAFTEFLSLSSAVSFVFVDDGSRDATLDVLSRIESANPGRVQILSLSRNSGKAEAVRQGLLFAAASNAAFVGYWDADLATPLAAIDDFARIARRYNDITVVYGARLRLLGHRVSRTLGRRIVSRTCARLARVAVGLPIGDTQCGAKLFRNTEVVRGALATPFSAGWLFDVELFTRIAAAGRSPYAFYEMPLAEWTEIPGSKVTGRAIRRAGFAMLRLIAERRFGLASRPSLENVPEVILVESARADEIRKAA